jgi:hypothetical protein
MGERRYSSYLLLTLVLDGSEWAVSHPGCALFLGKGPPGTRWTGGWVGSRAGLDADARGKIRFPCQVSNIGRPVHSQTLD